MLDAVRDRRLSVVRRYEIARSASYGVTRSPGQRRTASRDRRVSVGRRDVIAESAPTGREITPSRRKEAGRSRRVVTCRLGVRASDEAEVGDGGLLVGELGDGGVDPAPGELVDLESLHDRP